MMKKFFGSDNESYSFINLIAYGLFILWFLEKVIGLWTTEIYTYVYFLLPLSGGIVGYRIGTLWGGWSSLMGKAIRFFSLGLLAQVFGQISYAVFLIYNPGKDVPYPSIGDLGYFGSIPLYIFGLYELSRMSGAGFSLGNIKSKMFCVAIPTIGLFISYMIFLNGMELDFSQPLKLILDFAYPLGQAIYISLALLVLTLSRKYLGGKLKSSILLLLFALALQYVADFIFLYQTSRGIWQLGGINDLMYLVAYYIMSLGIISFYRAYYRFMSGSSKG